MQHVRTASKQVVHTDLRLGKFQCAELVDGKYRCGQQWLTVRHDGKNRTGQVKCLSGHVQKGKHARLKNAPLLPAKKGGSHGKRSN